MRSGRTVWVAALAAGAVVLTGCVRLTADTTLSDHNTLSQDSVVAFSPAVARELGITADQLLTQAQEAIDSGEYGDLAAEQYTLEAYDDGKLQGVHIALRDVSLDAVNNAGAAASGSGVAGPSTPTSLIVRDGDEYVITVATGAGDNSGPLGNPSLGLLIDSMNVEVRFTFPGPVSSATRGTINGKTVTLDAEDLFADGSIVIRGQATNGTAWMPILRWVGLGVVVVIVVGGAALLVWRAKRRQRPRGLPPIPQTH